MKRTRAIILGGALLIGTGVPLSGAIAQPSNAPTAREAEVFTACTVLDQIIDDMDADLAAERKWITRNRNRSGVSTDYFNRRVDEHNGQMKARNRLGSTFQTQCKSNKYLKSDVRKLCQIRQTRMNRYLHGSSECIAQRRKGF